MIKLLIPAVILTILIGALWFFVFPDREEEVGTWLQDQKEKILPNEYQTATSDAYEIIEHDFQDTHANIWRMTLVKVDPAMYDFRLLINDKDQLFAISDIAKSYDCTVAINGIFFDTNFDTLGLVINDGDVINQAHVGELASGVFFVSQVSTPGIVSSEDYVIETDDVAIQSGPILLYPDGTSEVTSNGQGIDSRSFIAIDKENNVYLGVVYPRIEKEVIGVSLYDLSQALQSAKDVLGIIFVSALNLDGGSSTGLYTKDFYYSEKNLPQNVLCLVKN